MPLNDTESRVLETKIAQLDLPRALAFLSSRGIEISPSTYYRTLGKIKAETPKRMYEKALWEYSADHLDALDELETCRRFQWECYFLEKKPGEQSRILERIVELRKTRTEYLAATRRIIEKDKLALAEEVVRHSQENPNPEQLDASRIGI
jgi:hypothetical protein